MDSRKEEQLTNCVPRKRFIRKRHFLRIGVLSLDDLLGLMRLLDADWVFRGQSDGDLPLKSTLERVLDTLQCPPQLRRVAELSMIREFKRTAAQYLGNLPSEEDYVGWLATMQHHGAPTRLLDFTSSFHVAAFFASQRPSDRPAIWAIKLPHLIAGYGLTPEETEAEEVLNDASFATPEGFYDTGRSLIYEVAMRNRRASQSLWERTSPNSVVPVEPETKIERLHIQRGIFLFPTNLEVPLEQNLTAMYGWPENALQRKDGAYIYSNNEDLRSSVELATVVKFELSHSFQRSLLVYLHSVNMNPATLFPGLDGFCQSLTRYAMQEIYPGSWFPNGWHDDWRLPHLESILKRPAHDGLSGANRTLCC